MENYNEQLENMLKWKLHSSSAKISLFGIGALLAVPTHFIIFALWGIFFGRDLGLSRISVEIVYYSSMLLFMPIGGIIGLKILKNYYYDQTLYFDGEEFILYQRKSTSQFNPLIVSFFKDTKKKEFFSTNDIAVFENTIKLNNGQTRIEMEVEPDHQFWDLWNS